MLKKSKFWKSGLKLIMKRRKKHFWFYKYCSIYTLKFYAADIWCSPLVFANVYIWIHQPIFALPLRDLRVFMELSAKIIANRLQTYFIQRRSFWAVRCSVCTVHIKISVCTSECDSRWFSHIVRWIRGGHAKIARWI